MKSKIRNLEKITDDLNNQLMVNRQQIMISNDQLSDYKVDQNSKLKQIETAFKNQQFVNQWQISDTL